MTQYRMRCFDHKYDPDAPEECDECAMESAPSRHVFGGGQEFTASQLRAIADNLDEEDKRREYEYHNPVQTVPVSEAWGDIKRMFDPEGDVLR